MSLWKLIFARKPAARPVPAGDTHHLSSPDHEAITTDLTESTRPNPFASVTVCFVPRAVASNPLSNLELVGTLCKMGDPEFERIEKLRCDIYYPAGTFLARDQNGDINSIHTWSDIGQLDYAFNDYLNFLMDLRRIYEGGGSRFEKIEAIKRLGEGTGRQGHSHAVFIDLHGGPYKLFEKCAARRG